jgi:hypothetical protein
MACLLVGCHSGMKPSKLKPMEPLILEPAEPINVDDFISRTTNVTITNKPITLKKNPAHEMKGAELLYVGLKNNWTNQSNKEIGAPQENKEKQSTVYLRYLIYYVAALMGVFSILFWIIKRKRASFYKSI